MKEDVLEGVFESVLGCVRGCELEEEEEGISLHIAQQ